MVKIMMIKRIDSDEPIKSVKEDIPAAMKTVLDYRRMNNSLEEGILEFANPNSKPLQGIDMLRRAIYLNKRRKEWLDMFFAGEIITKRKTKWARMFDESFYLPDGEEVLESNIFVQEELDTILFNLEKRNSIDDYEELRKFVHENFFEIRSVEDLENLAKMYREGLDA